MPIASITSDYTGRKRDISILQYPDAAYVPNNTASISISSLLTDPSTVYPKFGKFTRFCAGVQKLIQRYTIILLTDIASQPDYPEFGTALLKTLNAGISPVDTIAAAQLFHLASYRAVGTLRQYQSTRSDIPADERIVNATLEDIVLSGGLASFSVAVKTDAGDTINFVVPLPK
jgi:hypothetical protein